MNRSKIRQLIDNKKVMVNNVEYITSVEWDNKRVSWSRRWEYFVSGIGFKPVTTNRYSSTLWTYKINSDELEKLGLTEDSLSLKYVNPLSLNKIVIAAYIEFRDFMNKSKIDDSVLECLRGFSEISKTFNEKGFQSKTSASNPKTILAVEEEMEIDYTGYLVSLGYSQDIVDNMKRSCYVGEFSMKLYYNKNTNNLSLSLPRSFSGYSSNFKNAKEFALLREYSKIWSYVIDQVALFSEKYNIAISLS